MIEYRLVFSDRKSLSVEVNKRLEVVVRAPFYLDKEYIEDFVKSREKWIEKAVLRVKEKNSRTPESLSEDEIKFLKQKAKTVLNQRTEKYSKLMNLYPESVKITSAKTRFGSCSGKNHICYSYKLIMYPEAAVDYVVVHELAHIKYKNHGKLFYKLVEKYLPDYKEREKLLKNSPVNYLNL